jgi:phosphatidylglycerol:prolipoprotein diacylglycerol transferase
MWQHLPEHISPYILQTPWFNLHWYGFMYAVAYAVIYAIAARRLVSERFSITKDQLVGALLWSILGLAIGARLFYVLFYEPSYYFANPLMIVWPFGADGSLAGIAGLSYHGGLIGIVIALLVYCRRKRIRAWELGDLLIPIIPLGFAFGRIGNFINGELFGRPADVPWGMYFPRDPSGLLRHPSQLYESLLEGFLLFIPLWFLRKRLKGPNMLGAYLIGYSIARFAAEFFRQPDPQLGLVFGPFSMGQALSMLTFIAGFIVLVMKRRRNKR